MKTQLELREHRAGTECSRKLKQLSNTNLGLEDRLLQVLCFLLACAEAGSCSQRGKTVGPLRAPVNCLTRLVRGGLPVGPLSGLRGNSNGAGDLAVVAPNTQ